MRLCRLRVCLCLCGRRKVGCGLNPMRDASLPTHELLEAQAEWLAPARARLLRRIHVARRRRVLELGCGSGAVTGELVRRSGGRVIAVDRSADALQMDAAPFSGAFRVCADGTCLPFSAGSFDLVFCQFALVWMDAAATAAEVYRVLQPGGVWIDLEPDYEAMIEYPAEVATRSVWLSAIARCGGDPQVGRKLPGLLRAAGFSVRIDLPERLDPPSPLRLEFLRQLPLSESECKTLEDAEAQSVAARDILAHLPVFLLTATK